MEGNVANDDEDVVLCGAPRAGGEEGEGTPSAGEDGRDDCFSAERSIERIMKIIIFDLSSS